MIRWVIALAGATVSLGAGAIVVACSSSSSPAQEAPDAGGEQPDASSNDDTGTPPFDAGPDAPMATTTIAEARQTFLDAGSVPAITVNAVVTAIQGPSGDQVNWYVEDPGGGPYSGILVYCDPLAATSCPCKASCANHVAAAPLHTLVSISGTISSYHGQVQLEPTAQTILQSNFTPPPTYTASAADLAEIRANYEQVAEIAGTFPLMRPGMVAIVADGKLQNYLIGREPVRDFTQSNGHGRAGIAAAARPSIGVLKITAKDGLSTEDLFHKLTDMAKDRGLKSVYYVETMGSGNAPRLLYRIGADGKRELVRGAVLDDLDLRALRSGVEAAGKDLNVANSDGEVPTTVLGPALLMDDVTVKRANETNDKLPFYPAP